MYHLQYYLRQWSYELDVPIVSIDYSLAPEAPFPRALEECTMAYSWILQNLELLGDLCCESKDSIPVHSHTGTITSYCIM